MNKLVLSFAIISTLGLSGCGSETIEDVKKEFSDNGTPVTAPARVIFDPANAVISVPNDLLFSGTVDGTLNLPVEDPLNGSDPFVALSALDGWSTVNPFTIDIDLPSGTLLDGNSVSNPASVRIFETLMGGDNGCEEVPRGAACLVVSELTFGVDFISQKSGASIVVVPIKPLKGKTSYILALTNNLQDDSGRAIAGSGTYESVRQNINEYPLGSDAQRGLQAVINSYENAIVAAGADHDSLIYTMAMTTQSTTDVLFTAKALLAAPLAQGGLPPVISVTDTTISVAQAFAMQGLVLPPNLQALYSTANLWSGSVTLPYYLGVPTAQNPMAPINDWWRGLCDSGVMLAGLAAANPSAIPAGPLSQSDGVCMAVSEAAGLSAPGLRDLSSVMELDTERNLTKFSPVPAPKAMMPLDVQMTTPDISPTTDAVRASFGLPALTAIPAGGWPIVMLQHGITSKKEDMLAMTGILSAFGFATVAIDHPLHGSRGFDITGPDNVPDGIDDINASRVSATHYMNLASLLTTRDNLRQSTVDMLGLRLGLSTIPNINGTNVHFLGHSLGAITGINFLAVANTPLSPALDALFSVSSNSLAMPGIMVANFLMESPAFGDLIKSSLTFAQSPEFQGYVGQVNPGPVPPTEAQMVGYYRDFYALLTLEQQGALEGIFAQFTFAAQTVTDAGDPINYVAAMAASQTPTHLIEVVGNGSDNLSDQVIPNSVATAPLAGTEGAVALLGLPSVSETTLGSGVVRFVVGHHGSILDPSPRPEASDAAMTGRATQEMQGQVAGFFLSGGYSILGDHVITITDGDVVN
jgi:Pla-1/cef family extracellular lipase